MLSVKRNWLNYIFTIAVIVLMTGIAEYCREPEIIFSEIAALAAGALSAPEQIWRVNRSRMFCYIAVCSILGVIVVRYLPFGYWGQMVSAFAAGQMIFLCSKTTFAPMISAAVLPVLLQTDTWIYPVSAVGLTALICILQLISVKAGAHLSESYQPLPAVSADRSGRRAACHPARNPESDGRHPRQTCRPMMPGGWESANASRQCRQKPFPTTSRR